MSHLYIRWKIDARHRELDKYLCPIHVKTARFSRTTRKTIATLKLQKPNIRNNYLTKVILEWQTRELPARYQCYGFVKWPLGLIFLNSFHLLHSTTHNFNSVVTSFLLNGSAANVMEYMWALACRNKWKLFANVN